MCFLTFYKSKEVGGFMTIATLTSKGQITVPKDIRQHFNLQAGDRLEFVWVGEELRVRPLHAKWMRYSVSIKKLSKSQ